MQDADPDLQSPFATGSITYDDIQVRYQARDNIRFLAGVNKLTEKFSRIGLSGAGLDAVIFDNQRLLPGDARCLIRTTMHNDAQPIPA